MNYTSIVKASILNLEKKLTDFQLKSTHSVCVCGGLFLIFVLLLFLNRATFMVADDYIYSFVFTTKGKIFSFGDIIESQSLHYNLWGGRLVAHTLLQSLLLLSPWVIDVLNSLLFVIFLLLISFHIQGRLKLPTIGVLLGVFFVTWIFQPAFAESVLWVTGAVNYLWGMVIVLLFLLPYRLYRGKALSPIFVPVMFFVGLLGGCMNENTSIAMIVMSCLFLISFKKEFRQLPMWAVAGILGALIGFLVMVAAPGNYARAEGVTNESFVFLYRFLMHSQSFVYHLGGLNLLTFILGTLFLQYGANKLKVATYWSIYFVGLLISIYAMVLSPSFPPRAWFGAVSFNVILLGILYVNLDGRIILVRRIKWGLLVCGIAFFGFTCYDAIRDVNRLAISRHGREIKIDQARQTGDTVEIDKCIARTKFGLSDSPDAYILDYMSVYYGVTFVNSQDK